MGLFKIENFISHDRRSFGFGNRFFRIIRNIDKDYYFYGFFDFAGNEYRTLHKGMKLPLSPTLITSFCIVFNIFFIPFVLITFLPYSYFEGAKNFVTDSVWSDSVRFFNWVNFAGLALLILILIFNQ